MLYKSVLLLIPFLTVSFGCSCLQVSQKDAYDHADIVAHVTVANKSEESNQVFYEIHYEEVFKPRPPKNPHIILPIPLPNDVVTAKDSAGCGVEMQVDQEYLIAGDRENNTLSINLCNSLNGIQWSSIDKKLLKNLRSGFQKYH